MSGDKFVILPLSIVRDRTLTHRQRVALEALISFRSARSGKVYATLEDIADRCGLHPHGISTAVNELARAGYIRIKRNRRGCNDYHFLFAFHDWKPEPEDDQKATESADPKPPKTSRKTGNLDGIKTSRNPGTRLPGIREQDFPESGKPLQTNTDQKQTHTAEPATDPATGSPAGASVCVFSAAPEKKTPTPTCPHGDIIALYHEVLPELLPAVPSLWPKTKGACDLKDRWGEDERHRDLEFWRRFFGAVRTNPHWMGESPSGWAADLAWLVNIERFAQVVSRMVNGTARKKRPSMDEQLRKPWTGDL